MKTSILSFFAAGAMLLASSTPAIAAHDSIITPEQRIERSAQELAAESIELATQEVKKLAKNQANLELKSMNDSKILSSTAKSSKKVVTAMTMHGNTIIAFNRSKISSIRVSNLSKNSVKVFSFRVGDYHSHYYWYIHKPPTKI